MYHYNYEKRLQRTTQYMFTDPLNLPLPSTSIHSLPSLWSRAPRSCNTKQTLGSFIEQIVNLLGLNGIWRDILGHSGIWMGDELQNHELSIIERMVDLPAIREDLYVYYIHTWISINPLFCGQTDLVNFCARFGFGHFLGLQDIHHYSGFKEMQVNANECGHFTRPFPFLKHCPKC